MSEEWGPWIEHDGKGCPCKGLPVECKFELDEPDDPCPGAPALGSPSWDWEWVAGHRVCFNSIWPPVAYYRLRRPPALREMIDRIAKLDTPVRETEDA